MEVENDNFIINSDYNNDFIHQLNVSLEGGSPFIPTSLGRVTEAYNLMPNRFTLIGSTSGAGKSAYIDQDYITHPWRYTKDNPDIHYEALYYSMERKKMFKHAKWLSWLLYKDTGSLLSADTILGWNPDLKISKEAYKVIRGYDREMSDLLDVVHVHDGRVSVDQMATHIRMTAERLGTLFVADAFGVMLEGEGAYIATFNKVRQTRLGKETYAEITHKGESFTMIPNSRKYFYHKPNTYFFIILDGVGLVEKRPGQSTKQAVDEMTDLLADARDVYGASPVMVSQFNRAIADIHRQKSHGADLSPQEGDFKDSSGPYQAADLVLGLFDPVRFKAYDDLGLYGGYDVRNGMVSPHGATRFRSLHVLKNSFGIDNLSYGLKFLGEVGHWDCLPYPDTEACHKVYSQIAAGL